MELVLIARKCRIRKNNMDCTTELRSTIQEKRKKYQWDT